MEIYKGLQIIEQQFSIFATNCQGRELLKLRLLSEGAGNSNSNNSSSSSRSSSKSKLILHCGFCLPAGHTSLQMLKQLPESPDSRVDAD